jgi:hypothetical protein
MNIYLLYYFEREIYNSLASDKFIYQNVKSINTSVQRNPPMPHILLSLSRFSEEPPYNSRRYSLRFNICLFNESYKLKQRLELTSSVKNAITTSAENGRINLNGFELINLKCPSVDFLEGKDNNTTRSLLEFSALLETCQPQLE